MSDGSLRVVLDASAIIAFVHESIAVGELIAEVSDDEDCYVGLPHLSLVEAKTVVTDHDRLEFLVNHPATRLVADDPDEWPGLCDTYLAVGQLEAAQAAVLAWGVGCAILTRRPMLYAGAEGDGPVLPFE